MGQTSDVLYKTILERPMTCERFRLPRSVHEIIDSMKEDFSPCVPENAKTLALYQGLVSAIEQTPPASVARAKALETGCWLEEYKTCGCTSVGKRKDDLLGYCAKHGHNRRRVTKLPKGIPTGTLHIG